MVAFNFGDATNFSFQSFDVNWFRFAKSCMLLDPFEERMVSHAREEPLGEHTEPTRTLNSSASSSFCCLGAEAFGRIIVFIQDGVELMFF